MQRNNILTISVVVLAIAIVAVRCFDSGLYLCIARSLFFSAVTFAFYKSAVYSKKPFFFYFLLIFTLSEVINLISMPFEDLSYMAFYICNTLYIIAYLSLLWHIFKRLNIKAIFNRSLIAVVIMSIFGFFLGYQTIEMALESNPEDEILVNDYITIVVFLVTIVLLLVCALLDYLQKQTNYHLFFLIAIVRIVFSEIIQIRLRFR